MPALNLQLTDGELVELEHAVLARNHRIRIVARENIALHPRMQTTAHGNGDPLFFLKPMLDGLVSGNQWVDALIPKGLQLRIVRHGIGVVQDQRLLIDP